MSRRAYASLDPAGRGRQDPSRLARGVPTVVSIDALKLPRVLPGGVIRNRCTQMVRPDPKSRSWSVHRTRRPIVQPRRSVLIV